MEISFPTVSPPPPLNGNKDKFPLIASLEERGKERFSKSENEESMKQPTKVIHPVRNKEKLFHVWNFHTLNLILIILQSYWQTYQDQDRHLASLPTREVDVTTPSLSAGSVFSPSDLVTMFLRLTSYTYITALTSDFYLNLKNISDQEFWIENIHNDTLTQGSPTW